MRPARQPRSARSSRDAVEATVVDDHSIVDQELRPVIRRRGERVGAGTADGQKSSPTHAESFRLVAVPTLHHAGGRRFGVDDRQRRRTGPRLIGEVFRRQSVGGVELWPARFEKRPAQRGSQQKDQRPLVRGEHLGRHAPPHDHVQQSEERADAPCHGGRAPVDEPHRPCVQLDERPRCQRSGDRRADDDREFHGKRNPRPHTRRTVSAAPADSDGGERKRDIARKQKGAGRCVDVGLRHQREDEPVHVRRRRDERIVVRAPRAKSASEADLALDRAIWEEDEDDRDEQRKSDESEIAHARDRTQRFAKRHAVEAEDQQRHGHEHRPVAAREHLQGREACGQTQIALPPFVQIRVQRREPERDPLHARERHLPDAIEPRRRALPDDPADDGGCDAEPDAPGQHVRADAAQDARQHADQVRREQRIAGQPDHRRREQRDADHVLAVRERQAQADRVLRQADAHHPTIR